jgi:hypothetical protein
VILPPPPPPPPGWLDGPRGLLRALAIMLAGCLIGGGLAAIQNVAQPAAQAAPTFQPEGE